jgi:hypothetical protein
VGKAFVSHAQEYKPPITSVFGGDGKLDVRINCISPGAVNTALLRNTGALLSLLELHHVFLSCNF